MMFATNASGASLGDFLIGSGHSRSRSLLNSGVRPGVDKSFEPLYGKYVYCRSYGDEHVACVDPMGLSKLYMYSDGERWALSDSILELVEAAKQLSWPVTLYLPAIAGLLTAGGVGDQLLSYRTPYREISLLPHWKEVVVGTSGSIRIQNRKRPQCKYSDLREAVVDAVEFFSSLLQAYCHNNMSPYIALSGGIDSRCTLAVLLDAVANGGARISAWTSKAGGHQSDWRIASSICEKYGIPISDSRSGVAWPSFRAWEISYLGEMSLLASFPRVHAGAPMFSGACGEVLRNFYDWRSLSRDLIVRHDGFDTDVLDQVYSDMRSALASSRDAYGQKLPDSILHYRAFRNRFHFGRNGSDSVFNFWPLVSAFDELAAIEGYEDYANLHKIIGYAFRDVLDIEYDSEEKAFRGTKMNYQDPPRAVYQEARSVILPLSDDLPYGGLIASSPDAVYTSFLRECINAREAVIESELLPKEVARRAAVESERLSQMLNSGGAIRPRGYKNMMAILIASKVL